MAGRIYRWFDERLALGALRKFMVAQAVKPVPNHVNWFFTLGTAAAFLFLCQVLTGILLAFYYQPTFDHAYDSVADINHRIAMGWLIRSIHAWGSHLMVFLLLLHMIRVFMYGGYKKPRELTWIVGALLLFAVLTLCFTGTLLPMDQLAYWGTKVATSMFGGLPVLGDIPMTVIRGGEEVTGITLGRFFILHILILPAAVMTLIALHIILIRRLGISTKESVNVELQVGYETLMEKQGMPFYPRHAWKEIMTVLFLLGLLVSLAVFFPAGLGAKADVITTEPGVKPEWYFLSIYQLLKYFPKWLGVVIVNLLFALFILLPFVDRSAERIPAKRKRAMWIGAGVLWALIMAGVLGALSHRNMNVFGKQYHFDDYGIPEKVQAK